jgi:hypothetical protein
MGSKSFAGEILQSTQSGLPEFLGFSRAISTKIAKANSFKLKDFGSEAPQLAEIERPQSGGRGSINQEP